VEHGDEAEGYSEVVQAVLYSSSNAYSRHRKSMMHLPTVGEGIRVTVNVRKVNGNITFTDKVE
jgi:hypothetical protein